MPKLAMTTKVVKADYEVSNRSEASQQIIRLMMTDDSHSPAFWDELLMKWYDSGRNHSTVHCDCGSLDGTDTHTFDYFPDEAVTRASKDTPH